MNQAVRAYYEGQGQDAFDELLTFAAEVAPIPEIDELRVASNGQRFRPTFARYHGTRSSPRSRRFARSSALAQSQEKPASSSDFPDATSRPPSS